MRYLMKAFERQGTRRPAAKIARFFIRFHRARQAPPPEVERQMPPPRSYKVLIRSAIAAAAVGVILGLLLWQWSGPGFEPSQQHSGQDIAAVAQRAVLYEEDPNDPQGKQAVGSVIWRTEAIPSGTGEPPELAVLA